MCGLRFIWSQSLFTMPCGEADAVWFLCGVASAVAFVLCVRRSAPGVLAPNPWLETGVVVDRRRAALGLALLINNDAIVML